VNRVRLLDGRDIACINREEAEFLAAEVEDYLDRGITIPEGGVVLDVGANIGLFSMLAAARAERVFAFEPIPAIFAVLEDNARRHGLGRITPMRIALSDREASLRFSYYPKITGLSSSCRVADEREKHRFLDSLVETVKAGRTLPHLAPLPAGVIRFLLAGSMDDLFTAEEIECPARTMSTVVKEIGIQRIDLLKIDVEGAERQVLDGIDDATWPLIRQIVVEVEAFEVAGSAVIDSITGRGFAVEVARDEVQRAGDLGLLFAKRA
jgi:FkbM family methyltransferase